MKRGQMIVLEYENTVRRIGAARRTHMLSLGLPCTVKSKLLNERKFPLIMWSRFVKQLNLNCIFPLYTLDYDADQF